VRVAGFYTFLLSVPLIRKVHKISALPDNFACACVRVASLYIFLPSVPLIRKVHRISALPDNFADDLCENLHLLQCA
jgi:hypothetical protein